MFFTAAAAGLDQAQFQFESARACRNKHDDDDDAILVGAFDPNRPILIFSDINNITVGLLLDPCFRFVAIFHKCILLELCL